MRVTKILLVYDWNPNIRELMRRELTRMGYKVRVAKNPKEIIKYAYWPIPPDAIILDPEGIHKDLSSFLWDIDAVNPNIPVIIHGFNLSDLSTYIFRKNTFYVDKKANSIDTISQLLSSIFDDTEITNRDALNG